MKSTFDQDTILYQRLIDSSVKAAISGDVYKWVRPSGSVLEDIVINSIASLPDQITRGSSNVNIYVPALQVGDATVPDTARMGELTALVLDLLSAVYADTYQIWAGSQTTIEEPGPSWYVNLRFEFQFLPSH